MKVKTDSYLKAETLGKATIDAPKKVKIVEVFYIEAKDLKFKSEEGKYEISVECDGDVYDWMANKTSLKTIINAFSDESDKWIGKTVGVYALDQNVSGKMQKVIYCKVV